MKQTQETLREKYSKSQQAKKLVLGPDNEVQAFDKKLHKRREMIYPEYDLDKLWRDTCRI